MTTITNFKRDNHFRSQIFHPDSFQHQGKANLNLLLALLQYLPAGEIVLDPMAGTGSALVYLDYEYPVICGELEAHWANLCETNRKSITISRLFAASSPALCNQLDASRLPLADGSMSAIVTSPPYWDMLSDWHINSHNLQSAGHDVYGIAYGLHPQNVGNIHIYENYLRAMFTVYGECGRVLRPGGVLALILKDRIHKQQRVPIIQDTITLLRALNMAMVRQIDRNVTPSFHRNVISQKYPTAPQVNTETVLIFERCSRCSVEAGATMSKIALIQGPKPDSAPSWQLFRKQLRYAARTVKMTFVLTSTGIKHQFNSLETEQLNGPETSGFRARKEYAFNCVADLVTKYCLATGAEIDLHCSMDYGRYLVQRLETIGCTVNNPTAGLNLGQKLKWYTERG